MEKVSIIIPTYNSDKFLYETIESVLAQTYHNYEILIIDDGSTDNTKEVLKPFKDKIKYIYQKNSGGPAKPRNIGIKKATGKYIAIFDSDDIMMPQKLDQSVKFLENEPNVGMVFTNFMKINEKGQQYSGTHLVTYKMFCKLNKKKVGDAKYIIKGKDAFETLFFENYIGTSGVIVRKEIFSKVGLFNENVTHGGLEDRDMWFRICRFYDIGYLDLIGHKYRIRKGSVSKRTLASNLARASVIIKYSKFIKSKKVKKQANLLSAQSLYGAGYQYQNIGNFKKARKYYFESIKICMLKKALRGLLISLIGRKLFYIIKSKK
jgi:glycosyltransferase involved in cell wall biosynthesis